MKEEHRKHLENMATQCDRVIVRMTMKQPSKTTLEDVGYITGSLAQVRDALTWAAKQGTLKLDEPLQWADRKTPEDEAISAAFPTRSGSHDEYAEAMRLVGDRHSKGALVALVNWLLVRIKAAQVSGNESEKKA